MDATEILTDLARRPLDQLDLFWDEVGAAQLNAHPGGHPNSIAWLIWHTGREIDAQMAGLTGAGESWAVGAGPTGSVLPCRPAATASGTRPPRRVPSS